MESSSRAFSSCGRSCSADSAQLLGFSSGFEVSRLATSSNAADITPVQQASAIVTLRLSGKPIEILGCVTPRPWISTRLHPYDLGWGGDGWSPLVGDCDGNCTSTPGLYHHVTHEWRLSNHNSAGGIDLHFGWGGNDSGGVDFQLGWGGDGTYTVVGGPVLGP